MRYVAIDLGDKRTGIAVGDSQTRLVTPGVVLSRSVKEHGGEALLEDIVREITAQLGDGAGELVVGLAINMDDTEGPRAKMGRDWGARIAARTGRVVHFQDERLTSAEAEWTLAGSGLTHAGKKGRRDAIAAAAILRDFLAGLGG